VRSQTERDQTYGLCGSAQKDHLDRIGLEQRSRERYLVVKSEYDRLLPVTVCTMGAGDAARRPGVVPVRSTGRADRPLKPIRIGCRFRAFACASEQTSYACRRTFDARQSLAAAVSITILGRGAPAICFFSKPRCRMCSSAPTNARMGEAALSNRGLQHEMESS
jgi:hypothetical protein